jgi:hypothetical protein
VDEGDVFGRCHLRGVPRAEATCPPTTKITYCSVCEHWFCETCKKRWWERGIEAVKELIDGKLAGCCGPKEA